MKIEFRFREESSSIFGKIKRPVAEVFLQSTSGEWFQASMYIDSGADLSLIPRQLGELLGLKVEQGKIQEIRGIGEKAVPVIIVPLSIRIGPKEFEAQVAWCLIEEVPPLLGRLDVFERFEISFNESKGVIVFEAK